jgi:hypothetical protein
VVPYAPIRSHPSVHTHPFTPIRSHPSVHTHPFTPIRSHPSIHTHPRTHAHSLPAPTEWCDAVRRGDVRTATDLLRGSGIDVDVAETFALRSTALMLAAQTYDLPMVRCLLYHRANAAKLDAWGDDALAYVICNDDDAGQVVPDHLMFGQPNRGDVRLSIVQSLMDAGASSKASLEYAAEGEVTALLRSIRRRLPHPKSPRYREQPIASPARRWRSKKRRRRTRMRTARSTR